MYVRLRGDCSCTAGVAPLWPVVGTMGETAGARPRFLVEKEYESPPPDSCFRDTSLIVFSAP